MPVFHLFYCVILNNIYESEDSGADMHNDEDGDGEVEADSESEDSEGEGENESESKNV